LRRKDLSTQAALWKCKSVVGNEGKRIGQLTQKLCDHMVTIPMTGHIDSLNVSVATGILLYEVRRQQAAQ